MRLRDRVRSWWILALWVGFVPVASASPFFSIKPIPGASFPAVSNSAVLVPGAGPPIVFLPPAGLGVAGAPADDVNALSVPGPLGDFFFSVGSATTGFAGAVTGESAAGQAASDIYGSTFTGSNTLVINQDVLGLLPAIAAGVPAAGTIDDLDALEWDALGGPIHFAMFTGHAYAGTFPGCGADIFVAGPILTISYITLGLASCSDDIDALHIDSATGDVYFSLVPGSPSFALLGLPGPAEIYVSPAGAGPVAVAYAASLLGLHPTDDVDALAWMQPAAPPPVPSLLPGVTGLLVAAFATFGAIMAGRRAGQVDSTR